MRKLADSFHVCFCFISKLVMKFWHFIIKCYRHAQRYKVASSNSTYLPLNLSLLRLILSPNESHHLEHLVLVASTCLHIFTTYSCVLTMKSVLRILNMDKMESHIDFT